jgi:hypothetical protein
MIKLTEQVWVDIEKKLHEEWQHKPSVFLMRSVMQRELGFTVRRDSNYDESRYKVITTVYLDFFNNSAETMFRLRFL